MEKGSVGVGDGEGRLEELEGDEGREMNQGNVLGGEKWDEGA